jgi:uncharacterized membrane protein
MKPIAKGDYKMKFRKDKDILFEAGFFIFLVLIFFARWLQNTSNQNLSVFIAIWATMLVRTIYQSTKPKPTVILVDERGQRGSEKAAYYVLWLTIFSLGIFGMLNIGFPPPEINFIEVGFFLPLGMFVLYALFAFYFHKKGDI